MSASSRRWAAALACVVALWGCGGDDEGGAAGTGVAGTAAGTDAAGTAGMMAAGAAAAGVGAAGTGAAGTNAAAGTGAAGMGAAGTAATAAPDEVVTLAAGDVGGNVIEGSVRFLAIPYAKPPVGDLRWKAPMDPEPWAGMRYETDFAQPCAQTMSDQTPESRNEDCLYLNVWKPEQETTGAPVMVWIHGGGFTTGSTADVVPGSKTHLWYDGKVFAARHGIVVVTLQYRLGAFGFLAHPALADEGSPVGNQGLLDQRKALEWVRDNISAFGGDPNNVTIFGQSAGSGAVCMHVASPGSRGLFQHAISESGGCTTRGPSDDSMLDTMISDFESNAGCDGEADVLACLRGKAVEELIDLTPIQRTSGSLGTLARFGPVVDGDFLPEPAKDLFERGDVAQVDYMLGATADEQKLYWLARAGPTDDDSYLMMLEDSYGADFAQRIMDLYPVSDFDGKYKEAMIRVATDASAVCSTHATARAAVGAGLNVYMFNFAVPWSIGPLLFGAAHASEISHVFGTPYIPDPSMPDAASDEIAEDMNAYWASFATDGDPTFDGAPVTWPVFAPDADDNDQRIQFGPDVSVVDNFRKEECTLWREYYASQQ